MTEGTRYGAIRDGDGWVLRDAVAGAEARIAPALGNNVTHFRVTPPGAAGAPAAPAAVDVLVPPGPNGLGARGSGAGNPMLFPFPNRVQDGRYSFGGKDYALDVNEPQRGHHIHGFVSRLPWRSEDGGAEDGAGAWQRSSLDLGAQPDVMRQYPFPCRLEVRTALRDGVLIQEFAVENTGAGAMPFGFGTHPWFPAALDGAPREQTQVRADAGHYWEVDDRIPTGRTLPVEHGSGEYDLRRWRQVGDAEYDDVWTQPIRRPDGWSEAGIRYPNRRLAIVMEASPEFREWVVFTPRSRPTICLEPYTCVTNAINLQPQGVDAGLIVLAPGATWRGALRLSLRTSE